MRAATPQFEKLYAKHTNYLRSTALRLTKDAHDSEDLMQEAAIRMLMYFHKYDTSRPFTHWAARVMRNVYIDIWHRQAKPRSIELDAVDSSGQSMRDIPDSTNDPAEKFDSADFDLADLIAHLNEPFQKTFALRLEGWSYDEIASALDISVGTVRSKLHRAKKYAKLYLTERGYGPS